VNRKYNLLNDQVDGSQNKELRRMLEMEYFAEVSVTPRTEERKTPSTYAGVRSSGYFIQ
jgi:hypothetical protein